jgi:hypothetical protein
MLDLVFDASLWIVGPALVGSLIVFSVGGPLLTRHFVLSRLRIRVEDSDFSGSMLQDELRDYARYVIDTAWPAQRRGEVALQGIAKLNRFQATLTAFEPATESRRASHAEALRAYNQLIEARSERIDVALDPGPYRHVLDVVMQDLR